MKTPNGMSACRKSGIGCAFDKFDRFVESQSGKDALHDTVGISYELVFPEVNGSSDAENNDKNIQEKATNHSETYLTTQATNQLNLK